jgi:hypothetical protein
MKRSVHSPIPRARNPLGSSGQGTSALAVALLSSAVFGLSGSFAKSLLETGWVELPWCCWFPL